MQIYYRGILDRNHSWGVVATELCLALEKKGFDIKLSDPVHKDQWDPTRLDPRLESKLSINTSSDLTLSYCVPVNLKALPKENICHIYNYEYTQIPRKWNTLINQYVKLFLPSSNFAKDIFIKNGVNPSISEVLPHGIDLTKYNPQIPAVDLNSKKFTFLCVSAPHYRKGLNLLLQAFGEEFATIEEVELIIKTSIPKKRAPYELDIRKVLDEAREKLALPRVRVITDYYPSLAPLYRAAHAYVSPTHSECFGLTELEAVCCGLPVIVTNYGGYLDFLNQDNAFLVHQKPMYAPRNMQYWHYSPKSICADPDVQHLRQQMRYVFNNYKLAQERARRAYEQIAPNYTWDKVADIFIRLAEQYNIVPKGQIKPKKDVPAGILVPDSEPPPNKNHETAKGSKIEALRESLRRKAKQEFSRVKTEKQDPERIKISAYALLFNEEKQILGLLENISDAFDEIVLVDGGSKDETVRRINQFIRDTDSTHIKLCVKPQKDKVRYSRKWNQAEQRNFGVQQCTNEWVFMIDADERLDQNFKKEIRQLAASGRSKAYAFPKHHYWEAKDKIRIDNWWYPNYSYRLWKNNEGIWYENKARHCQPIVKHLKLPDVLIVKQVKNFGPYSDAPIHHLHYIKHQKNEMGLFRANDRDVSSIEQLNKGLQTKPVLNLDHVLKVQEATPVVEVRSSRSLDGLIENGLNAAYVMENFAFYSGGRYHLYQEAYTLAQAGVNVWLITNQIPVYINDFPKLSNFRIVENWKTPPGVRFDLVVGTPSNCGMKAYNLARANRAKFILVSLETPNFIREYRGGKDSTESYWADYRRYFTFADVALASARLPAKYLERWAKIPEDKIELMPPAINEFALKRAGTPTKSNTIVFISRIVEHKHLDSLLKAIARVQKQLKEPPIIDIIGNGKAEVVQKMLKGAGVQGRFFSNINDVAKFQLIKRSRGLITCSNYEGFGMSPLEGMICEVPVIVSDLPIFHETLGDRVTYYKLKNVTELANKIQALILKPEIFASKVVEAKKWADQQYTLAAMTQRWKDILVRMKMRQFIELEREVEVEPVPTMKEKPKFSVCIIALNEAEYIEYNLKQMYNWDCCHEILIVEGSVKHYPKNHLSSDGLSGDSTTEIIKNFPDPDNKIVHISGTFKDKIEQRNQYAERVTGTHVLVLDSDEFYSKESLELLKQDIINNPEAELFAFNFSQDLTKRTYYHLWYNFQQHVIGGYWDIPHNRIYKWTPGTLYTGEDHNHPTKPDGKKLIKEHVKMVQTRAKCVHTGFVKLVENQKDKNDFYVSRGEGKEKDPKIRARRQMYVDCRRAYETWKPKKDLPHKAKVVPYTLAVPESLLEHPYIQDPKYLLRLREGGKL